MSKTKYKLEILAPAQRELEEIAFLHRELVGPRSARRITNRIFDALERLRTSPNIGVDCAKKPLKLPGYRMLVCGNHLCFYRLIDETVFVYHIVDGRADYPRLMRDLE